MNVTRLNIHHTSGYTGLSSERPHLQIKQHQADLQIRQTHVGIVEISTRAAQLHVDQTEAFADANLKGPLRLANEFYQSANAQVAEHITKKRQQGDQMMKIENGFGAFARLAKANSEKPEGQLRLVNMPSSIFQTKIHYEPGDVNIRVPNHQTDISVARREPDIHIPKWQTDVYLRQKNHISFEAVGSQMNKML